MKEKISTVKNPLTVIAIFAGTAELSGTAILPLLESQSQQTYIWFLMLFPLILILLFFATLNWNHKVLYAPSDFSNEDNFVNLLKKPSIQETIDANLKNEEELTENEKEEEPTAKDEPEEPLTRKKKKFSGDTATEIRTKEDRQKSAETLSQLNRHRIREGQMAELMVLQKLEQELKTSVQREMKLEVGGTSFIFDGVVLKDSKFIGIEVKYFRHRNALNAATWQNLMNRFSRIYNGLSKSEQNSFSIIFAIVTDEPTDEVKSFISNKLSDLEFPVDIRVYDFDELRKQLRFNF